MLIFILQFDREAASASGFSKDIEGGALASLADLPLTLQSQPAGLT
jgi:hypothetical protein